MELRYWGPLIAVFGVILFAESIVNAIANSGEVGAWFAWLFAGCLFMVGLAKSDESSGLYFLAGGLTSIIACLLIMGVS